MAKGLCKPCYDQAYHKAHRDEHQAYHKAYYKSHPEKWQQTAEENKARYAANKEQELERCRIYRETHGEQKRARGRAWYHAHREQVKAYRDAHREQNRRNINSWRHANPDDANLIRQRRRARKRALPDTLTREQWQAIQVLYNHCCAYCGEQSDRLTQDHVIPLAKGGGTVAGNIVPACLPCNSRKKDGLPITSSLRLLLL